MPKSMSRSMQMFFYEDYWFQKGIRWLTSMGLNIPEHTTELRNDAFDDKITDDGKTLLDEEPKKTPLPVSVFGGYR